MIQVVLTDDQSVIDPVCSIGYDWDKNCLRSKYRSILWWLFLYNQNLFKIREFKIK